MNALLELVKIVNRKRLSKIDIFDKTFLNQSNINLYYKLYEGLESGKITSDESAAKYLYDSDDKDAKFRKLKSRFKGKILKSILLFGSEEVSNSETIRAYYECLTHNQIIEIIIKLTGTTQLVYELVKDDYNKAQKYSFYDILRNYSYYLLAYYSFKGDKKSFIEEEKKYLQYIEFAQKEQFAKYLYNKVIVDFEGGAAITSDLMLHAKENLDKLYKLRIELKNTEIDFQYFYLALQYYEYNNELEQILNICDEADMLMNKNSQIITNTRRLVMLLYRMKALLNIRDYTKGIELLKSSDNIIIPEASINWYILKETEFKLYLQDDKIKEAYNVYEQVLQNKTYKRQAAELTEKWKIYHAYLVFMDNYLNKGDYKFNLARFLNDVPVNSKDKSGFNFAIRVIEILFNAARKDYNLIFSKMDALRVYRSRYLNDNTYKRNHLFLSVLLKAEKSGFNNKELVKADWQEITELRNQNKYFIADWEIIPYETLWDIFVELAKK